MRNPNVVDKKFLGQPKAFYLIFFLEIWERFGFYGVQALLVLFMVQSLKFSDTRSDILFTCFTALAYLLPALGGYVGDHVLGTKRTILLGAIVLAIGYAVLSLPFLPPNHLVLPLAIIAVGNGLFKSNPSSLLSKIYHEQKLGQDSGFTLYYMAINIGGLLGLTITPFLNKYFGWHIAFSCCVLGLVIAIVNYLMMRHLVKNVGSSPDFKPLQRNRFFLVLLSIAILIVAGYWLLEHKTFMTWLLVAGAIAVLIVFFSRTARAQPDERKGMILFVILFFQAIVFWVLYYQMPTSINLFVLRNVAYGSIPPATFQSLDAIWILVMSPILAAIYNKLGSRDLSLPAKYSLGTFLTGLSFLVFPLAAFFSKTTGIVNPWWVVLSYLFFAIGELLVSALSFSVASKFVPQRLMGYAMGISLLSISMGSILAGRFAILAAIPKDIAHDPKVSLPIYIHLFSRIGVIAIAISILMFCFVPALKRLIVDDLPKPH